MAARKRGNGEVHELTIEVLKGIRSEISKLREETRGDTRKLREEMHRGFGAVTSRIDHLVEFSGDRWRDHEERLTRIEKQLKRS